MHMLLLFLSASGKRFIILPGLGSSNNGIDVASLAFKKKTRDMPIPMCM